MENILKEALKEAGKILTSYFGSVTDYDIKENQSNIVTKADIESERRIQEIISQSFPEHNILGEEMGFQDKGSAYTWVIDPIDGTSNFAAGIPWFGVIICLLKDDIPILSGAYLPIQDQLYVAEKGGGAFLNDRPILVSSEGKLKNVLFGYSLDYSDKSGKTEAESILIRNIVKEVRNLRSTNSIVDFCYCADGRLGAVINQTTKIWDIAGPGLLVEEAGGKVSDLHGMPLDFSLNKENYGRNFEVIFSNNKLHNSIVSLVNDSH